MVKSLIICLAMFSVPVLHAQDLKFSVEWGKELRAARNSSLDDIIGYDASGIYAVKREGRKSYILEHYDNKFEHAGTFDLDFEEEGYECTVESVLQLKGKLYMIYSYPHKKEKLKKLLVTQIDKGTLKPTGDKKKVGEISFEGKSKSNSGYFAVLVSRDSSKVLVQYALPYDAGEPEQFGFNVFDEQLNSLWEKKVTLPYKDELFDIASTRIDNQGNVYLLGLVYKDKRKSKRHGSPNYNYEVFAYRNNGSSMERYPVVLEDRFITDMQIAILDNSNIICSGFYSAKGTTSIKGTYFLSIDAASKAIKTKSFKEFGLDFITENLSGKEANKAVRQSEKGKEPELYEYDLDKLIVGKDGSAILVGEQYFVVARTSSTYINGRTQTTTVYHYYYNDIIAVKINPDGQIAWAQKIAKSQHTTNDGGFYSSYAMVITKGRVGFIFNDNPKNLERGESDKGRPSNVRADRSLVVLVTLDENGKETKQPIFNSVDVEVIARPKVCEQISNNTVILFGQRGKDQQFARMTFN